MKSIIASLVDSTLEGVGAATSSDVGGVSYVVMHSQPTPVPKDSEAVISTRCAGGGFRFHSRTTTSVVPGRVAVGSIAGLGSNVSPQSVLANERSSGTVVGIVDGTILEGRGAGAQCVTTYAHLIAAVPMHLLPTTHAQDVRLAALTLPVVASLLLCQTALHVDERDVVYIHHSIDDGNDMLFVSVLAALLRRHGCRVLLRGELVGTSLADAHGGVGVDVIVVIIGVVVEGEEDEQQQQQEISDVVDSLAPGGRLCFARDPVLASATPTTTTTTSPQLDAHVIAAVLGSMKNGSVSCFDFAALLGAGNRHDLVTHALHEAVRLVIEEEATSDGSIGPIIPMAKKQQVMEVDLSRAGHMHVVNAKTMLNPSSVVSFV
eukprot:PhM_4_TR7844/c0_g1_i1/m.37483